MEKTLPRRGKGTSKADYSEKEEEENIVRRRKPQNSGASSNVGSNVAYRGIATQVFLFRNI